MGRRPHYPYVSVCFLVLPNDGGGVGCWVGSIFFTKKKALTSESAYKNGLIMKTLSKTPTIFGKEKPNS
jgi:hypothetical protein